MKTYLLSIFLLLNFNYLFAQDVIYVSTLASDNYTLYELNIDDCSLNLVTSIDERVFDITFHPNGKLYGLEPDGRLWVVNILNGTTTLVNAFGTNANLQTFNSMTASVDGIIYVTGTLGEFYSYNVTSGVETFWGTMPFQPSGDLTFYQGNLYVAAIGSSDLIVQVNITNPESSFYVIADNLIGDIYGIVSYAEDCANVNVYAMSIEEDENLTSIYQIDFENNSLTYICELNEQIGGGASTFEFLGSVAITIQDLEINFPTSCTESDGTLTVTAAGGIGQLEYSIVDNVLQTNNQFTGLSSGIYSLTVSDENGCQVVQEVDLNPTNIPQLIEVETTPISCLAAGGIIQAEGSAGTGNLVYSIDGINFQVTGLFENLPVGNYTVTVQDENLCSSSTENVDIGLPPIPMIDNIILEPIICDNESVSFSIELSNFTGELDITLNDTIFQNHLTFDNLPTGTYRISIVDELGCGVDTTIVLARKYCAIYVPNAFSPNGDGYNDVFKIYPHPKFEGVILSFYIFDRWGNTLYGNDNYDLDTDSWDGNFKGKPLNPGVFVYVIKVDYGDGIREVLSGDVSLVK